MVGQAALLCLAQVHQRGNVFRGSAEVSSRFHLRGAYCDDIGVAIRVVEAVATSKLRKAAKSKYLNLGTTQQAQHAKRNNQRRRPGSFGVKPHSRTFHHQGKRPVCDRAHPCVRSLDNTVSTRSEESKRESDLRDGRGMGVTRIGGGGTPATICTICTCQGHGASVRRTASAHGQLRSSITHGDFSCTVRCGFCMILQCYWWSECRLTELIGVDPEKCRETSILKH